MTALLYWPATAQPGNGVTITNLVVAADTVTFDVRWNNNYPEGFLWSDTVWVFVDYNDAGAMKRLPLALGAGSTLTETSAPGAGEVIEVPGNDNGVWVAGNARSAGSFSATVRLRTAIAALSGVCVYASNYPPLGNYTTPATVAFTGTPEYRIELKRDDGGAETRTSGSLFPVPEGYTVLSFTDKTGAPGRFSCVKPLITPLTAFARCGSGTLTLSVTVTEAATVNWYADPACTVLLQGDAATYTTPRLTAASTPYYVKATNPSNPACASQLAITAAVSLYEGEIGGRED
jgi:hypothetical protein